MGRSFASSYPPLSMHLRLITLLALVVGAACSRGEASGAKQTVAAKDVVPAATVSATDERIKRADLARIRGDSTATVWMVMASDFQCPWCKLWHDSTAATIDKEYVATGKIRVAYLNFPLQMHPNSRPAAEAAMCGGAQGKFWEFHDALFDTQTKWAPESDPIPSYEGIVAKLGLDLTAWKSCMTDHVMAAMVQADYDRGVQAGVKSTPSFFIGNEVIASAGGPAVFRPALDRALAKAASGAK